MISRTMALVLTATLAVGACGGAASPAPATAPSTAGAPSAAPAPSAQATPPAEAAPSAPVAASAPSASTTAPGAPALVQPWATATLIDVTTGQPFRIADHAGKVIFIETMAIWCINCRAQQADAQAALGQLDRSKVVYIALDVEPSEKPADLAAYREQNGWDFVYAVSPPEVSRALAAEFGDLVLNPPATPIIVVGADGTITLTEFGHKSPDALVALARAHGA